MHETKARRLLGVTIFVLAGIVWALSAGSAIVIANHGGLHAACASSGPWQVNGANPEAGPVDARFSWWPVGRACEWPASDGGTALVAQNESWTATYSLLALGALSLSGLVITLLPARRLEDVLTG
jgi:hypothetical protein